MAAVSSPAASKTRNVAQDQVPHWRGADDSALRLRDMPCACWGPLTARSLWQKIHAVPFPRLPPWPGWWPLRKLRRSVASDLDSRASSCWSRLRLAVAVWSGVVVKVDVKAHLITALWVAVSIATEGWCSAEPAGASLIMRLCVFIAKLSDCYTWEDFSENWIFLILSFGSRQHMSR